LSDTARDTLAMIDALPTRQQLDFALGTSAVDQLLALVNDPSTALGLQIRAIRVLPSYCPDSGCASSVVHDALAELVRGYVSHMTRSAAPLAPQDLLRLRAALEALGATRSGLDSDAALFTASPQLLLHHPSRDLQAAAVRALRGVCSPDLCTREVCTASSDAVRALLGTSPTPQVRSAIISALQGLAPCSAH
jgi:hypothetical protein